MENKIKKAKQTHKYGLIALATICAMSLFINFASTDSTKMKSVIIILALIAIPLLSWKCEELSKYGERDAEHQKKMLTYTKTRFITTFALSLTCFITYMASGDKDMLIFGILLTVIYALVFKINDKDFEPKE